MTGNEIWFRSSDGTEKCCNEGSVAFGLMEKDGSFTKIDGPGGDEVLRDPAAGRMLGAGDSNDKPAPIDLSALTVKQLYERAALMDVPVTERMKKADLIAAIEARLAETSDED